MLVKRPRPSTPEPAVSGSCPLERNPRSPKGWKKREPDHIGLAIVAALEKSGAHAPAMLQVVGGSTCLHSSAPIAIPNPCRTPVKVGVLFSEDSDVGCTGRCNHNGGGRNTGWRDTGFFSVSPPPPADFLSHCNLCRKRLHGKDIYMYKGNKGFCSIECRYQQIMSDESKEKCWSEASKKQSDVAAGSPNSGRGRLFLIAGVAAA